MDEKPIAIDMTMFPAGTIVSLGSAALALLERDCSESGTLAAFPQGDANDRLARNFDAHLGSVHFIRSKYSTCERLH